MRPDWSKTLFAALAARQRHYDTLQSRRGREHAHSAAFALIAVVSHLEELPEFRSGVGVAMLKDLHDSLLDVREEPSPGLLLPAACWGSDTFERRALQATCVAGVRSLVAFGERPTKACRMVATEMAMHGVKGRRGAPLAWTTIYSWHKGQFGEPGMDEQIESFVKEWRSDPSNAMSRRAVMKWLTRQARKLSSRPSAVA